MDKKVMDKKTQKKTILITSLGVGRFLDPKPIPRECKHCEHLQEETLKSNWEKMQDGEYKIEDNFLYDYEFPNQEGNQKICKSAFVADVISQNIEVDTVLYIGTVKSQWHNLYLYYGKNWDKMEASEDFQANINRLNSLSNVEFDVWNDLRDIGVKGNIHTPPEKFNGIEKKLKKVVGNCIGNRFNSEFLIIKYGINSQEIMETYNRLKNRLKKILDSYIENSDSTEEIEFEFVFDLTGSLRPLPVYQMLFLEYFKNLSNYKVSMRNMYYAMFEVKKETDKIVKIVDLQELLKAMDLNNALSEFRNTGSVGSVCNYIEDDKNKISNTYNNPKALLELLKDLDWVTNTNNRNILRDTINKILSLDMKKSDINTETTALIDMIEMLQANVAEEFVDQSLEGKQIEEIKEIFKEQQEADFQYKISCWYYKNGRYGLAIATAIEAFRSYLVQIYLGENRTREDEKNVKNREYAYNRIDKMARYLSVNEDEKNIVEFSERLRKLKKDAKSTRDIFAHNLDGASDSKRKKDLKQQENLLQENLSLDEINHHRQVITDYMECLKEFHDQYFHDSLYSKIYCEAGNLADVVEKEEIEINKLYLVIANRKGKIEDKEWEVLKTHIDFWETSENNAENISKYKLGYLSGDICKRLKPQNTPGTCAEFLYQYLKYWKQQQKIGDIVIIFYNMPFDYIINYAVCLLKNKVYDPELVKQIKYYTGTKFLTELKKLDADESKDNLNKAEWIEAYKKEVNNYKEISKIDCSIIIQNKEIQSDREKIIKKDKNAIKIYDDTKFTDSRV